MSFAGMRVDSNSVLKITAKGIANANSMGDPILIELLDGTRSIKSLSRKLDMNEIAVITLAERLRMGNYVITQNASVLKAFTG